MLAITGVTGHTGSYFLQELIRTRYPGRVRCLVRSAIAAQKLQNCGLNIEPTIGDLNDDDCVRQFLTGVTSVVHIANIHYSPKILQIGKECGVSRYVLVHTTGIYSQFKEARQSYIDIEKSIAPLMQVLNVTVLRPTMIFGDIRDHNISKFIRLVDILPVLPVVSGGHAMIQPVNARDLARALFQALPCRNTYGNSYDLSGEKAITIRQLYLLIAQLLNKKRFIVSFPEKFCIFCARMLRFFSFKRIDLVEKVQRMSEDRSYSHQAAMVDFDYAPEQFEAGLCREINEYLANKPRNRR